MNGSNQTSKEYFMMLTILHGAIMAGQVIFVAVALFLDSQKQLPMTMADQRDMLLLVVPLIAIGGILGSSMIFKQRIKAIEVREGLTKKLASYKVASIIRWALLEGVTFFCIVFFMLVGDILFLAIAGITMVFFFFNRATKHKVIEDLNLLAEERQELEND